MLGVVSLLKMGGGFVIFWGWRVRWFRFKAILRAAVFRMGYHPSRLLGSSYVGSVREFFLLVTPGAGGSVQLNKIKNELARAAGFKKILFRADQLNLVT